MATTAIGMPVFSGGEDEDVNRHIELFEGYLAGIGVDPADNAGGPPTGWKRALGLFRATMQGPAGIWFDENLTGKNWELYNLFQNHGQGNNWANLVARTMPQLNATAGSNSFRAGTRVHAHAENVANALHTLANLLPNAGINQNWTLLGGRPTDRAPVLTGTPANTVVITLRVGNAVDYFKNNYPTVLREKRLVRFGNLFQENSSVRDFYNKVVKYGRLLDFPQNVIEDQFFRGLSMDSMLEVDRIGADRPIRDVVDALEKIEKRKAEMRLGLSNRNIQSEKIAKAIAPVQLPPVSSQEPHISKTVTQELTRDQINQLLKTQSDNITNAFQAQIQALQDKLAQQSNPSASKRAPPIPSKNSRQLQEFYEDQNPFDYSQQFSFDEIMGEPQDIKVNIITKRVAQAMARAEKKKMDREIDNVVKAMAGLDIQDNYHAMDTSNLVDGSMILEDADGNEYTAYVTRSIKKK